jgi:hypothetical protein
MDIQVPKVDARTRTGSVHAVIDRDTGQPIGTLECGYGTRLPNMRQPGRKITLFGGRHRGCFETHAECVAFAKGVESAINADSLDQAGELTR